MQSEGTVLNCTCKVEDASYGDKAWNISPGCPIHGRSVPVVQPSMWRTEITKHEEFEADYFGSFGQECKKRNGWELVAVFREDRKTSDGSVFGAYYRAVWKRFQ